MSTATKTRRVYGWRPDKPDARDHLYAAPLWFIGRLPASVDLRSACPPIYDQTTLSSCTGNAIAGNFQFCEIKEGLSSFIPSRLFIYYNERVIEHTVTSDAGAEIRDGIKSVAKQGVCPETLWPYDVKRFATKPPKTCYDAAKLHLAVQYSRVAQTSAQMKGCLAEGFAYVCGISVYESFESDAVAKTGKVPMPKSSEELLGGHAIVCVGYDDAKGVWIMRNSWGVSWGMKGYFTLPYAYLLDANLADDFWTIRLVK